MGTRPLTGQRWTLFPGRRNRTLALAIGIGIAVAVVILLVDEGSRSDGPAVVGVGLEMAAVVWLLGTVFAPLRGDAPPPRRNVLSGMEPAPKRRLLDTVRGRRAVTAADDVGLLELGAYQLGRSSARGLYVGIALVLMACASMLYRTGTVSRIVSVVVLVVGVVAVVLVRRDRRRAARFLEVLHASAI